MILYSKVSAWFAGQKASGTRVEHRVPLSVTYSESHLGIHRANHMISSAYSDAQNVDSVTGVTRDVQNYWEASKTVFILSYRPYYIFQKYIEFSIYDGPQIGCNKFFEII